MVNLLARMFGSTVKVCLYRILHCQSNNSVTGWTFTMPKICLMFVAWSVSIASSLADLPFGASKSVQEEGLARRGISAAIARSDPPEGVQTGFSRER